MESLIPRSAIELTAIASFCIAGLLVIATRASESRVHYVRVLAIFMITGLAFVANHWTTYFAAIFVIATAVTDTEFLQTLAAIIRGDKNYFSYKIELVGASKEPRDMDDLIQVDAKAARVAPDETRAPKLSETYPGLVAEQLAILQLERLIQAPVTRNVRISGGGSSLELDGLVQGRRGFPDRLIEVKYSAAVSHLAVIANRAPDLARSIISNYRRITKRDCVLDFIVVVADKKLMDERVLSELGDRLKQVGGATFRVFDYGSLNDQLTGEKEA